jgi:hypothetical protein
VTRRSSVMPVNASGVALCSARLGHRVAWKAIDDSDSGGYACHMPSREAVLGFLFGLAVLMIAYGILGDIPAVIAAAMIPLIFAGWIFFSIRDRIRGRRKSSA